MESYEYQAQQFASPTNYYGFNYTNQQYAIKFNNNESPSINSNNYNANSFSSNSGSSSSNYSPSNSFFSPINTESHFTYEPNQSYNVSALAKSYHLNQSDSPKSYPTTSAFEPTTSYTPSISHYQPTHYSDTYSSTPHHHHNHHNSIINASEFKSSSSSSSSSSSFLKKKDPALSNSHKRPKVMKLDIRQTNIGFPVEYNQVHSDDINSSSKLFQCTECSASFTIAAKLFMHQHKHHKNRSSNECPICYKKFNSPANALVHLRAHTQEKTYKCDECSLAFCDSSTLKKHIRTHTGEKPYECQLCLKRFAQSGNLKRHLSVHEKYDTIKCASYKTSSPIQEIESPTTPEQNVSAFTAPNYSSLYVSNSDQFSHYTNQHVYNSNNHNNNYSYY